MKIVCFKYGEALYAECRIFADREGGGKIPLSFCFYLIETEDRKILVDTGCELCEHYGMYVYKKPLDLMREYGLTPDDITDVIITHSHLDHIEGVPDYKKPKIYIQKREYEGGKKYFSPEHQVITFEDEYILTPDVRIERVSGHSVGSCVVFAGKHLLCGDEAYYYRNLSDKVRVNNCYSKEASQAFVEKYSQSEWIPLVYHDPCILPNAVGFQEIV